MFTVMRDDEMKDGQGTSSLLRVVHRKNECTERKDLFSNWNLFARLDSRTVQKLYDECLATIRIRNEGLNSYQRTLASWSIDSVTNIEFLPLAITFIKYDDKNKSAKQVIFASYNGGDVTPDECQFHDFRKFAKTDDATINFC